MVDRLYSYYDYEEAYYHMQWNLCITIGTYLLPYINNNRAKQLLKQLSKAKIDSKILTKLLLDVKIWLMIYLV